MFVYEKVPEKDYDFFRSMGLKNCWGSDPKLLIKHTEWCADRERNAYLVGIGGGYQDMPEFTDFWWNGLLIRLETYCGGTGNYDVGVHIKWFVQRIPIPEEFWDKRDEICRMIEEAFSVDRAWCRPERLKSIEVVMCPPEMIKKGGGGYPFF